MSQRILSIQAKSSDLNTVTFPNGREYEGYVPHDICVGGGDYIDVEIDIDTGKLVGWNDEKRDAVLALQDDRSGT